MFLTRSEYDRGVNTYSTEGRLFQVEYAMEAIKLGSTAVGVKTSDGVVLGVEKRVTSNLMISKPLQKIFEIDHHVGAACSGLMADSRTLMERARLECLNHWFSYNEPMMIESVAQAVSNLAIQFGDEASDDVVMSRPFGVAILFGGYDRYGPQLYHMDPSGTFLQFDAKAIGAGSEAAEQTLQEVYNKSVSLDEAISIILNILKQVMEDKMTTANVELVTITPKDGFKVYLGDELENLLDKANAQE